MSDGADPSAGVRRDDVLYIPKRRRLTHVWLQEPGQPRKLVIYYGVKEISFDEAELFPFAEQLLAQERFRAESAVTWSSGVASGSPYPWERVKALLDSLVEEGILKRLETSAPEVAQAPKTEILGSSKAASSARTWSARDDQCPALTQELRGVPLELGHLEIAVRVFRVAHPALDTNGRQVGEGNVSPRFLFLDLPTERRPCAYPGSRFQDDKLMNVTALKLMMEHWEHACALGAEMRAAFLARRPLSGLDPTTMSIGELHLLAVTTLAIPGYLMVRGEDPVANGALDAVLATLFRIVDGIRMATTAMLTGPDARYTFDCPTTSSEVIDYCEQKGLFLSATGVCAGPVSRMHEFLTIFIEGASAPVAPGKRLQTLVEDLDAAMDYGLAGLQVHCVVQAFESEKRALSQRLVEALGSNPLVPPAIVALREALSRPTPERAVQEGLARAQPHRAEIFQQAARWWKGKNPAFLGSLQAIVTPSTENGERQTAISAFLREHLGTTDPGVLEALARTVDNLFSLERRILRALDSQQRTINEILRRKQPPPLTGDQLEGRASGDMSDLGRRLAEPLGLTLDRTATATTLHSGIHRLELRD